MTANSCTTCHPVDLFHPADSSCGPCDTATGWFVSGSTCIPCHSTCETCSGVLSTQCLSCTSPLQFSNTTNECLLPPVTSPTTNNNTATLPDLAQSPLLTRYSPIKQQVLITLPFHFSLYQQLRLTYFLRIDAEVLELRQSDFTLSQAGEDMASIHLHLARLPDFTAGTLLILLTSTINSSMQENDDDKKVGGYFPIEVKHIIHSNSGVFSTLQDILTVSRTPVSAISGVSAPRYW